jgi:LmbE family N-acetylglucosaminyl deacetylase
MTDSTSRRDALKQAALGGVALLAVPLPVAVAQAGTAPRRLKVVVFGGHPDDPETMAGGTIARFAALGHEVVCLYLTRGEAGIEGTPHAEAARRRTGEAERACAGLGARARFAGQVDGATEVTAARYAETRAILDEEKPDLLLTHWPVDTHRDHRAASLLAYDAWLALGGRCDLYYGEVLTGDQTQQFAPTHWVDVTGFLEKKRAACFAHASQDPADMWAHHDQMQRFRGREAGCAAAEAFALHPRSRGAGDLVGPAGQE